MWIATSKFTQCKFLKHFFTKNCQRNHETKNEKFTNSRFQQKRFFLLFFKNNFCRLKFQKNSDGFKKFYLEFHTVQLVSTTAKTMTNILYKESVQMLCFEAFMILDTLVQCWINWSPGYTGKDNFKTFLYIIFWLIKKVSRGSKITLKLLIESSFFTISKALFNCFHKFIFNVMFNLISVCSLNCCQLTR